MELRRLSHLAHFDMILRYSDDVAVAVIGLG
jgi:hypothetical protein